MVQALQSPPIRRRRPRPAPLARRNRARAGDFQQSRGENLLPVEVGVDNDRNGNLILGASEDKTTAEKPYRFWLNNDYDNYADDTYDDQKDHPWTTQSLDNSNTVIESQRDLDDLARLHLKVEGIQSALEDGSMTLGIKWKTTISGEPKIRIFKAIEADGGTKYLSDPAEAANQMADGRNEIGVVQGTSVFDLPVSFWTSTSASSKKHFLFEGLGEGKGELTLVFKRDGVVIGEGGAVFLELLDIRKMYERWKIADAANFPGPDLITASAVSGVTSVTDPNSHPFQAAWDEDLEDKSYIVCVHGWRKNYNGARSDEITMFKRLWHRGFKGRYAGYYWPTLTGGPVGAKFNHSEYRAWKCGTAFKDFIETQLPSAYRKCVIAHSLGNVMIGSALSQGLVFDRYALLNGAIPAQCFDPDPVLKQTAATQTLATGLSWPATVSYEAWAGGDLSDDPVAALRALAYRNRVSTVGSTRLINFFLTADTAISAWEANQWAAGDGVPGIDSKPVDGYEYDIGVRLNYDPIGIGDRALTDSHEAMAMANQSMTKAVGGEGRTAGTISGSLDMNGAGILFADQHQAAFQFVPNKTWEFYRQLLSELAFSPTP